MKLTYRVCGVYTIGAALIGVLLHSSVAAASDAQAGSPGIDTAQLLTLAEKVGPNLETSQRQRLLDTLEQCLTGNATTLSSFAVNGLPQAGQVLTQFSGSPAARDRLWIAWAKANSTWKESCSSLYQLWILAARQPDNAGLEPLKSMIIQEAGILLTSGSTWQKPVTVDTSRVFDLVIGQAIPEQLLQISAQLRLALDKPGSFAAIDASTLIQIQGMASKLQMPEASDGRLWQRWLDTRADPVSATPADWVLLLDSVAKSESESAQKTAVQAAQTVWKSRLSNDSQRSALEAAILARLATAAGPFLSDAQRSDLYQHIYATRVNNAEQLAKSTWLQWSGEVLPALRVLAPTPTAAKEATAMWVNVTEEWRSLPPAVHNALLSILKPADTDLRRQANTRLVDHLLDTFYLKEATYQESTIGVTRNNIAGSAGAFDEKQAGKVAQCLLSVYVENHERLAALTSSDLPILAHCMILLQQPVTKTYEVYRAWYECDAVWSLDRMAEVQTMLAVISRMPQDNDRDQLLAAVTSAAVNRYFKADTLSNLEKPTDMPPLVALLSRYATDDQKQVIAVALSQLIRAIDPKKWTNVDALAVVTALKALGGSPESLADTTAEVMNRLHTWETMTCRQINDWSTLVLAGSSDQAAAVAARLTLAIRDRFLVDTTFWQPDNHVDLVNMVKIHGPRLEEPARSTMLKNLHAYFDAHPEMYGKYTPSIFGSQLWSVFAAAGASEAQQPALAARWALADTQWKGRPYGELVPIVAMLSTGNEPDVVKARLVLLDVIWSQVENPELLASFDVVSFKSHMLPKLAPVTKLERQQKFARQLFQYYRNPDHLSQFRVGYLSYLADLAVDLLPEAERASAIETIGKVWMSRRTSWTDVSPAEFRDIAKFLVKVDAPGIQVLRREVAVAAWTRIINEQAFKSDDPLWVYVARETVPGLSDQTLRELEEKWRAGVLRQADLLQNLTVKEVAVLANFSMALSGTAGGAVTWASWVNASNRWQTLELSDYRSIYQGMLSGGDDPLLEQARGRIAESTWTRFLSNDEFLVITPLEDIAPLAGIAVRALTTEHKATLSQKLSQRYVVDEKVLASMSIKELTTYRSLQGQVGMTPAESMDVYARWVCVSEHWQESDADALAKMMDILKSCETDSGEAARKKVANHIWTQFLRQAGPAAVGKQP